MTQKNTNPMTIWVIDMGSQTTQLVARRVRECGFYSEVKPYTITLEEILDASPSALIVSGGPASVSEFGSPEMAEGFWELEMPILGICYGMQHMVEALGGKVAPAEVAEYGRTRLVTSTDSRLFTGTHREHTVWMSHRDQVSVLPEGFRAIARTESCPIAAVEHERRPLVAVQFHPEVAHTEFGLELIQSFLHRVAGLESTWRLDDWLEGAVESIRVQVPSPSRVVMAVSGGVDSSVAAALVHRAIGERLIPVFVDNGLLRAGEVERVMHLLGENLGLPVRCIDAQDRFYQELAGVSDPEQKRKIIGRVFIDVFKDSVSDEPDVEFLGQGTLYPDVIESLAAHGGPTSTIKSHHNVGGLPKDLKWALVEPLRMLFKDEVRTIGRSLGLTDDAVSRQPFPGPGLAVRILGEVNAERVMVLQQADKIVTDEFDAWIATGKAPDDIWQWFAALLPVRSVGVIGDERTYGETIAIRAVTSVDAMTADWVYPPRELIQKISSRIMNEVKGVNRVVLDVSSKPPATIEWE